MGRKKARGRVGIEFREEPWAEEVERLQPRSPARQQAEKARREIEADRAGLAWLPCEEEGPGSTRLGGCVKLYVPFGRRGASAAPYGFVFELIEAQGRLSVVMIAFGERHPTNPETRSVYERAHKRLHGRYP